MHAQWRRWSGCSTCSVLATSPAAHSPPSDVSHTQALLFELILFIDSDSGLYVWITYRNILFIYSFLILMLHVQRVDKHGIRFGQREHYLATRKLPWAKVSWPDQKPRAKSQKISCLASIVAYVTVFLSQLVLFLQDIQMKKRTAEVLVCK